MDEKREQRPRLGPLFWVSMVLFGLLGGLVMGYRAAEHWLRVENNELKDDVKRLTEERLAKKRESQIEPGSANMCRASRMVNLRPTHSRTRRGGDRVEGGSVGRGITLRGLGKTRRRRAVFMALGPPATIPVWTRSDGIGGERCLR